jgi:hypothetical protein
MPDQFNLVSDLIKTHQNLGAYESPFSGSGVEFEPVWTNLPARGIVLHECGHIAANRRWNYPGVFSPFWRLGAS